MVFKLLGFELLQCLSITLLCFDVVLHLLLSNGCQVGFLCKGNQITTNKFNELSFSSDGVDQFWLTDILLDLAPKFISHLVCKNHW